jgi:hypothetical protein
VTRSSQCCLFTEEKDPTLKNFAKIIASLGRKQRQAA